MRPVVDRIMVIDDLADRKHDCDLLLDQNYFPDPETRYHGLLPDKCQKLFGPEYALLRSECRQARAFCRMRGNGIARVLVYFGGNDPGNLTGMALEVLGRHELNHLLVDAVVGPNNPHLENLKKQAQTRHGTRLHIQPAFFVELMLRADLCIGAGGTTTWERLCLGLPSLVISTAANQVEVSRELSRLGRICYLGHKSNVTENDIFDGIVSFIRNGSMNSFDSCNTFTVDGCGSERVARKMVDLKTEKEGWIVEKFRVPDPLFIYKQRDENNGRIFSTPFQYNVLFMKNDLICHPKSDLTGGGAARIYDRKRLQEKTACDCKYGGNNILVTSAANKVPLILEIKKASQRIIQNTLVIAGDVRQEVLTRHVADDFWIMPETTDTNLEALLKGCRKRGVKVVYPTRDGELMFWARNKSLFERHGIAVLVSKVESVSVCLDKLAFARFGEKMNLPIIPASLKPEDLNSENYVVKERYGSGSRMIGLEVCISGAWAHAAKMTNPIFQPFIRGKEASADAWISSDNVVKGIVMRTRDEVVNGESKVTSTFRDETIERIVLKILTALKLCGHIVMQFIFDESQKVFVIECNPRFGGASTTSIAAGLDSLYWSLLEAHGEDIHRYPYHRIPGEVRQIRVPHDIHVYDSHF